MLVVVRILSGLALADLEETGLVLTTLRRRELVDFVPELTVPPNCLDMGRLDVLGGAPPSMSARAL